MSKNDDQVARRIYWGMKEQGLTVDHDMPFDDLPRGYRTQLQAIADGIPMADPYEKLFEFADRAKGMGHYDASERVVEFLNLKGVTRAGAS